MLLKNLGVDRVIDYRAEDIKTVCLFFPYFSFPFFFLFLGYLVGLEVESEFDLILCEAAS